MGRGVPRGYVGKKTWAGLGKKRGGGDLQKKKKDRPADGGAGNGSLIFFGRGPRPRIPQLGESEKGAKEFFGHRKGEGSGQPVRTEKGMWW